MTWASVSGRNILQRENFHFNTLSTFQSLYLITSTGEKKWTCRVKPALCSTNHSLLKCFACVQTWGNDLKKKYYIQITCLLRYVCDLRADESNVQTYRRIVVMFYNPCSVCAHCPPVCTHGAHIMWRFHLFWSVVRRKSRRTSPRSHTSAPWVMKRN